MRESTEKAHYAWRIFAACCIIFGSVSGMFINCRGIYFAEASASLGVSTGTYATYLIPYGISAAVLFPLASRIFRKGNIKITLAAFLSAYCAMAMLMGRVNTMRQCCIVAVIQGSVGGVLALYVLPYLIKNWFAAKQGTVLGIAAMFSGVIAVIMNPVTQKLIAEYGWRNTYCIVAVAIWLLSVPAVLLWVKRQPADIGLMPYGMSSTAAPEAERDSIPPPPAHRESAKALSLAVFIVSAIWGSTSGYAQQLSAYSATINVGAAAASYVVSFCMLGNLGGKVVFGAMNDRAGVVKTSITASLMLILSFVLMYLGSIRIPLLFVGALLNGISMPLLSVQVPLLAGRAFVDKNEYAGKYSYICAMNCLISTASSGLISKTYDIFGSYFYVFSVSVGLLAIAIILLGLNNRHLKTQDI